MNTNKHKVAMFASIAVQLLLLLCYFVDNSSAEILEPTNVLVIVADRGSAVHKGITHDDIFKYSERRIDSLSLTDDATRLYATHDSISVFSPRRSIIIFSYDDKGAPDKVSKHIVKVRIKGTDKNTFDSKDIDFGRFNEGSYIKIDFDADFMKGFLESVNNSEFGIEISSKNDKGETAVHVFRIQKQNMFEAPGFAIFPDIWDDTIGIWAPVGLFGTNFQRTGSGMQFQVAPIGLAVGTKWLPAKDVTYLGGSLIMSWVIDKTENSNPTIAGASNNTSITASGITVGGLIDVSAWFYIGGAYSIDLSSNKNNPGWSMLIGPGPALVDFLNPLSKKK